MNDEMVRQLKDQRDTLNEAYGHRLDEASLALLIDYVRATTHLAFSSGRLHGIEEAQSK